MPRLYDSRKRVLVAGGAGFLGSLSSIARSTRVTKSFASTISTRAPAQHRACHAHAHFEFMRHDVTLSKSSWMKSTISRVPLRDPLSV
jgi:UDP-glucuronate decarboxylase